MSLIWDRLPILRTATTISVGNESIVIHPFQFIAWIGIRPIEELPGSRIPEPFPAIVDSGCTSSLIISPRQLRSWAKIEWNRLPIHGIIERKHDSIPVPYRRANVVLFCNHPEQRTPRTDTPPLEIELSDGIAVYGDGEVVGVSETRRLNAPRLPLIGMRLLESIDAKIQLTTHAMTCSLETIA
jgi:hypothetical protein